MSVQEGLLATASVGGTVIALLDEVSVSHSRVTKEWVPLGSVNATDVLVGVNSYKVTAKHGYVDNAFQNLISPAGGTWLIGTIFPRGGTTPFLAGSMMCTKADITGMKREAVDPVMENLEFTMFSVTHA